MRKRKIFLIHRSVDLLLKQPIDCCDNFSYFLARNFDACLPIGLFGYLPFGSIKFLLLLIGSKRGQLSNIPCKKTKCRTINISIRYTIFSNKPLKSSCRIQPAPFRQQRAHCHAVGSRLGPLSQWVVKDWRLETGHGCQGRVCCAAAYA